ncbi:MAG: hypothetical protein JHC61_06830 [Burkholderiaceae bacterium]|nr:hypothetical protein [Burkholderiaceae bacterium]
MHAFSCLPRTDFRAPGKENERPADRRHARKFQDVLDLLPDPLAANVTPLSTLAPLTLSDQAVDALPEQGSTRPIAPADGHVSVAPAVLTVVDGQTLTLRVSTGSLAGLIVQAEWGNRRLSLRLSAPEGPLAARLAREQRQLQTALSAALGGDVVVEVRHEY